MKNIFLFVLTLCFLSTPAAAQNLPPDVALELQKQAAVCQARGQTFSYDMRFLNQQDLTGDGLEDFIITSRGYLCDNKHDVFANTGGDSYHIFRADADGRYTQYTPSFRAYELVVEPRGNEKALKFRTACDLTLKSTRKGETRLQWEYDETTFDITVRNLGCSVKKKRKEDDDSWFDFLPDFDLPAEPTFEVQN